MAKKWTDDQMLMDSVSANLVELLPLYPKRMVRTDSLVHELGLPFSQIQILVMLAQGDMSVGELSEKLCIAKPNITPLVDSLRERGLVERRRGTEDHRVVRVHLLPAGEACMAKIHACVAGQLTEWRGEFSRSEIKELNNALACLIRIVRTMDGQAEQG